jgi:hypothetical protein
MTFDLEFLKTVISVLSLALGTASGVAALLVEFKDKATGAITKWGRYALSGLAASFLIGTANQLIDYSSKTQQAREAAKTAQQATEQTLHIVTDINRTLNPLKNVRASFWLTYPFDGSELSSYKERLDAGLRARLSQAKLDHLLMPGALSKVGDDLSKIADRAFTPEFSLSGVSDDGRVTVTVKNDSPLFPKSQTESFAHTVLNTTGLQIQFFKSPIEHPCHRTVDQPKPDITMSFGNNPDANARISLEYTLPTQEVAIRGFRIKSDSDYWNSSGTIISTLDLPGSQMVISAGHLLVSFSEPEKRVEPDLKTVSLAIAERGDWVFRNGKLRLETSQDGRRCWTYIFPRSFSELLSSVETYR